MSPVAKFFVCLLLVILVIAEIYLGWTYRSVVTDASNFDKVGPIIQSLFTPLVAAVTVLVSYLVINTQFERNRELEKIKQRLGEVYKRESDAYFKAWTAASASYRLLSELQKGTLDPASPTKIETAFSEAEPNLFVLETKDEGLFYAQWQAINEILALSATAPNSAAKIALWGARSGPLSDRLSKIRENFRNKYLDR